jgi:hypothetical protein
MAITGQDSEQIHTENKEDLAGIRANSAHPSHNDSRWEKIAGTKAIGKRRCRPYI